MLLHVGWRGKCRSSARVGVTPAPSYGRGETSTRRVNFFDTTLHRIRVPAIVAIMATKREFDTEGASSAKRVKMENGNGKLDAASNPYLAHWNDDVKSKTAPPRTRRTLSSANASHRRAR